MGRLKHIFRHIIGAPKRREVNQRCLSVGDMRCPSMFQGSLGYTSAQRGLAFGAGKCISVSPLLEQKRHVFWGLAVG